MTVSFRTIGWVLGIIAFGALLAAFSGLLGNSQLGSLVGGGQPLFLQMHDARALAAEAKAGSGEQALIGFTLSALPGRAGQEGVAYGEALHPTEVRVRLNTGNVPADTVVRSMSLWQRFDALNTETFLSRVNGLSLVDPLKPFGPRNGYEAVFTGLPLALGLNDSAALVLKGELVAGDYALQFEISPGRDVLVAEGVKAQGAVFRFAFPSLKNATPPQAESVTLPEIQVVGP